ncbi:hypothetical protein [Streptacidiphilus carbonis]|uniref:hypothetical protein n=1 Tax=Streptacidiphilus carbonis TaxID=105422 RepID=UPI000AB668C5|nr:hypothetical protein [Streptacidiphilus carbonis]
MNEAVLLGGLGLAGLLLLVLGVAGLAWRRDGEELRLRRALRWAKEVDLALPVELVNPLAARLKRRALAGLLLSLLIAVPVAALEGGLLASGLGDTATDPAAPLRGPTIALVLMAPLVVANAATGLWELARLRRADALSGDRPVRIALRDAVPGWTVWAVRVLALAPPLLAGAVLWWFQQLGLAQGFGIRAFAALLAVAVVALYGVESRQLAVLNGRQAPGSSQALAFDDAFRVRTVLDLAPLLPLLVYLVATARLHSVLSAADARNPGAASDAGAVWMGLGMLVFFFVIALGQPGVRRYYRGRSAPPLLPPTSETTSC